MKLFAAYYETDTVGTAGVDLVTAETLDCAEAQAWELAKQNADQYGSWDDEEEEEEYENCYSWVEEITNYDELAGVQSNMWGSPKMEDVCAQAIFLGYKEDWILEVQRASGKRTRKHKRERLQHKAEELREQIASLEKELAKTITEINNV